MLEFWPPNINPLLMIEWGLKTHPIWQKCWKNPLWIVTLSCKERLISLRPECPWRARRYTIVLEESVQYWYLHFTPPPAKHAFHLLSDHWRQYKKYFWIFSVILQKRTAIFFSIHMLWVTKKFHHFLRYFIVGEWILPWFNISPSSLPNRNCSWEEPAGSLLCGFVLATDRHANLWHPIWTHINRAELLEFPAHCCSNSSETCLIHKKFWPRNEYCHCLQIQFWSQFHIFCNFQHGPSLGVRMDPSFWLWCWIFSQKGVFTTTHCIEFCVRSPVSFVMKYCPISTTFRNPASIQKFAQFVLLWQLFISFSILLQ